MCKSGREEVRTETVVLCKQHVHASLSTLALAVPLQPRQRKKDVDHLKACGTTARAMKVALQGTGTILKQTFSRCRSTDKILADVESLYTYEDPRDNGRKPRQAHETGTSTVPQENEQKGRSWLTQGRETNTVLTLVTCPQRRRIAGKLSMRVGCLSFLQSDGEGRES